MAEQLGDRFKMTLDDSVQALRAIFSVIERIIVSNVHGPRSPDELAAK